MFDGAFAILDVPPFLGIKRKLLTAQLTFISGNPAMAKSMRIVVPLVSVFVRTVKTLIVLAIVPL